MSSVYFAHQLEYHYATKYPYILTPSPSPSPIEDSFCLPLSAETVADLDLVVVPPTAAHTHTIIFLHGRADSARVFSQSVFWSLDSTGRSLREIFPGVRWVFPQSERRLCEYSGERLSQWFDVWNLLDYEDREEVQAIGLRESVLSVARVIRNEVKRLGGKSEKVVLAGLSQGGATAVHALLNLGLKDASGGLEEDYMGNKSAEKRGTDLEDEGYFSPQPERKRRLGGLVCFSSRMPFPGGTLEETREVLELPGRPSDEVLRNTPVFISHCIDDPVVPVESGKELRDALEEFGMDVTWREHDRGGHWVQSPEGVNDVASFLRDRVFGDLADLEDDNKIGTM